MTSIRLGCCFSFLKQQHQHNLRSSARWQYKNNKNFAVSSTLLLSQSCQSITDTAARYLSSTTNQSNNNVIPLDTNNTNKYDDKIQQASKFIQDFDANANQQLASKPDSNTDSSNPKEQFQKKQLKVQNLDTLSTQQLDDYIKQMIERKSESYMKRKKLYELQAELIAYEQEHALQNLTLPQRIQKEVRDFKVSNANIHKVLMVVALGILMINLTITRDKQSVFCALANQYKDTIEPEYVTYKKIENDNQLLEKHLDRMLGQNSFIGSDDQVEHKKRLQQFKSEFSVPLQLLQTDRYSKNKKFIREQTKQYEKYFKA